LHVLDECVPIFTVEAIETVHSKLKHGKACGPDDTACEYSSHAHSILIIHPHIPPRFDVFRPATFAEVSKLISESSDTHCDLDPILSTLLKKCTSALLPTITTIINLSLASGVFLISSNLALYILFLKSLILIKMNCPTTDLSLIFLSFLNLLSV
jgi:hypothetical protein